MPEINLQLNYDSTNIKYASIVFSENVRYNIDIS